MHGAFVPFDTKGVTRHLGLPEVSATTATPDGICAILRTPGMERAFESSTLLTFAPKTGGRATTAVSIPGKFTVETKDGFTIELDRGVEALDGFANQLEVFRIFQWTFAGGVSFAASPASWPYVNLRLELSKTAPESVRQESWIKVPALRGCSHQHGASGGASLPELLETRTIRWSFLRSSACRRRGGCIRDPPARIRTRLWSSRRRVPRPGAWQCGVDALSHLGVVHDHRDPFVGTDPHKRIWQKTFGDSCAAACCSKRADKSRAADLRCRQRKTSGTDGGESHGPGLRLTNRLSAHRGDSVISSFRRRDESPGGCADRCRSGRCCRSSRSSISSSVGFGFFAQQRGGGHDLSGLAVAALRHVLVDPGLLQRVAQVGRRALRSS